MMERHEAAALVVLALGACYFQERELQKKLDFLEWAGPDNLDEASAAIDRCHPHTNFVGRIVRAFTTFWKQ